MSTHVASTKTKNKRAKPKAALAAKAKAKAKPRKAKPAAMTKGVKFRSRGRYKCTTNNGEPLTGMHDALGRAIGGGFDYDKLKNANRLLTVPLSVPSEFYPLHSQTKNTRRLQYSRQQGSKGDTQITSVVKLHLMKTQRVPLRVFVDKAERASFLKLKFGTSPAMQPERALQLTKQADRIRNLANALLPETDSIIRFLIRKKLTPVSTQTPVAAGAVGTQCDLVVTNPEGEHIVIENKVGCDVAFTHGKMMPYPFHSVAKVVDPVTQRVLVEGKKGLVFSTHRKYQLQALMTSRCYRRTFPDRKMGEPLLLRADRAGLHVYKVPQWAKDGEAALATRMKMT